MTQSAVNGLWQQVLENETFRQDASFGIYIDNPFCLTSICRFCCYQSTLLDSREVVATKNRYYDTLLPSQILAYKEPLSQIPWRTVYFGGGTGSAATPEQLGHLLDCLGKFVDLASLAEKTFEAHPSSCSPRHLEQLAAWRFTGLSLGVQTFDGEVLRFNERHNPSPAKVGSLLACARQYGMKTNLDLLSYIYRHDTAEDLELLERDLLQAEGLAPDTITVTPNCFSLELETPAQQAHSSVKVEKLRQLLAAFCRRGSYELCDGEVLQGINSIDDLRRDYRLVRATVGLAPATRKYSCSAWPRNPPTQSVLAFGGYKGRQPYSYLGRSLCYASSFRNGKPYYSVVHLPSRILVDLLTGASQ